MNKKLIFKEKIVLISFGVILSLVLLEIILRQGGLIYLLLQEQRNQVSLNEKGVYKILCLGESTTAFGDEFSYPSLLEDILNDGNIYSKFKVINKGTPGINSSQVLNHIDEYLNTYEPDLVVTMIGINDEYFYGEEAKKIENPSLFDQLRVVKLFHLLSRHISKKFAELGSGKRGEKLVLDRDSFNERGDPQSLDSWDEGPEKLIGVLNDFKEAEAKLEQFKQDLRTAGNRTLDEITLGLTIKSIKRDMSHLSIHAGRWYQEKQMYRQAEDYFQQAIAISPDYDKPLIEMGRYLKDQNKYDQSISLFKKAKELKPNSYWGNLELGRIYNMLDQKERTVEHYKKLLEGREVDYWSYLEVGDWFLSQGYSQEAEQAYLGAYESDERNNLAAAKLSRLYFSQNRKQEAQTYLKEVKNPIAEKNRQKTIENYNHITERILNRGIKMISMQYPLRDIAFLREQLRLKRNIVFVENKRNFQAVLQTSQYSDYFYDNFAGDFGHCTIKGNKLIAQNLAQAIKQDIFE